ncbi:histidine kinase [Tepidanaerobacter sp. GT38]|uniref:histidine kinase n=1 Tax=Tepidanaerobacter sp. GT38 TaxID=2722793 RepID=UPI001F15E2B1|nr:histidine kinase [Tepidanaerobacter sp. GT38]MCG1012696.1 histidine kinase [Tepidanaerobacter sp. GT38]
MIYKDLITLVIIFILLLTIGVRVAEKGLYNTMGLDLRPQSFDFDFQEDRVYSFTVLGSNIKLQKYYKIGNMVACRGQISFMINGKTFTINSMIPTGVMLQERLNLDKKTANMYN